MVKKPVCLVRRSVKTARKTEVSNFLIHAAKVKLNSVFYELKKHQFYKKDQIIVNTFQSIRVIRNNW